MQAQASVQTEKAERYMKALVNHFSGKVDAAYSENLGYVEFGFGRCDIQAGDHDLSFQITSHQADDLSRLQHVISSHLTRFTQNEITHLQWSQQDQFSKKDK